MLSPGVDYIEAFGGRERILRLGTFLEDLRSEGAAIHIISHGYKNEILKVVPPDDIYASFASSLAKSWSPLIDPSSPSPRRP